MNQLLAYLTRRQSPRIVPATPGEFADTFHPHFPQEKVENVGAGLGNDRPQTKSAREHAVFYALLRSETGTLTMAELAAAMGCSAAEATRRVKLSAAKLKRKKVGRFLYVSLSR